MWSAFGDSGCTGVKPPFAAAATPAVASASSTTRARDSSLRRTRRHSMNVSQRTRIELPAHVPDVYEVYVSGVRQVPGRDFEVEGRSLVFPRPLAQEGRLGFWRWASMWLGIAGTYRKHETVDIAYEADGRREVETGLEPRPYESG